MTKDEGDELLAPWVANTILLVVTAVWVGANIASVYSFRGYDMPESLNIAFTTIVGGVYVARSRLKGSGKGGDDGR